MIYVTNIKNNWKKLRMIIDCIADLHGHYPELEGGDLLIVAGDLTARDLFDEMVYFSVWLQKQEYKKKVFIAGNHDNLLMKTACGRSNPSIEYLCDSGTEFEGLKIWGSPWTTKFSGMNPLCMAFTVDDDDELSDIWYEIPKDTDILITHSPSLGMLDEIPIGNDKIKHAGSASLAEYVHQIRPRLHVCGHIHEGYGMIKHYFVNSSIVNEHYQTVNKPIRVVL
jgi:Icc-related predicted phosphoesterase